MNHNNYRLREPRNPFSDFRKNSPVDIRKCGTILRFLRKGCPSHHDHQVGFGLCDVESNLNRHSVVKKCVIKVSSEPPELIAVHTALMTHQVKPEILTQNTTIEELSSNLPTTAPRSSHHRNFHAASHLSVDG